MEEQQPTASSESNIQHSLPAGKHKPKKNPAQARPQKKQEKLDDDIDLDLSFVTNIFKRKNKPKQEAKKVETGEDGTDLEVSFNVKSIGQILWKYRMLFLIIIPIIMSIYVRVPSESLPITDEWATTAVVNYFKGQISEQVRQQYPNLPEQNRNTLVNQEWQKFVSQNKQMIDQNIAQASLNFKDYFQYEENGKKYTYMPDIDPYFWLRYARNYETTGHMGDEIRNGVEWDNHMLAPVGLPAQTFLHNKIIAWIHKIASIFSPGISLMQAAGFLPIIFSALAVIPAFFIARRVTGNLGGFFASAMVAVAPSFASRTPWGHADTDAYNIFFPLMIIWVFFEAYQAKELKNKMILIALSGLTTAAYGLFWVYWFVFDFIMGAIALYMLYLIFIYRAELKNGIREFVKTPGIKNSLVLAIIYFLTVAVFVTLFTNFDNFLLGLKGPIQFTAIKEAAKENLWPNVYTTVAELNEVDIQGIINTIGGKTLFWISVLGILLSFLKRDEHGKRDVKYGLLLALWFIGTIYASTKGIRFTLLIVPAFTVAFGIALGTAFQYITRWSEKQFEIHKIITGTILCIAFLLLLVAPARAAYNIAYHDVPIMNDAWANSLEKIKQNSKPDAIITSWWDFGHHFKYIADRPVTFDGASQNTPQAHWVGKLLLTDDEEKSVGILRMLDCGANTAFDELEKKLNDISLSVDIINKMVVVDKPAAKKILVDNGFTGKEADEILELTHCNPPEAFIIASDDMIGKAGVWSHFGSWDFRRAEIWTKVKKMPKQEAITYMLSQKDYGYTREQAENIYNEVQAIRNERDANNWISPWPNYFAGKDGCTTEADNHTISCGNGMKIDLIAEDAQIPTQQGYVHPQSLVYMKDGKLVEKKFADSSQGVSVIYTAAGGYFNILSDPALSKSMFTRMFFMDGEGLKHFEQVSHEKGMTGTEVYVYKVNW